MNEILQLDERSEKHEQMIELVIVLFKQLLQIPDSDEGSQTGMGHGGKMMSV